MDNHTNDHQDVPTARLLIIGTTPSMALSSAVHQVVTTMRNYDIKMQEENREPTGHDYLVMLAFVQALASAYVAIPKVFQGDGPMTMRMHNGEIIPMNDIEETRLREKIMADMGAEYFTPGKTS